MSLSIRRQALRKKRGYSRYTIWMGSGEPVSFEMPSPPRPQTTKWQVMFAERLARALQDWACANFWKED